MASKYLFLLLSLVGCLILLNISACTNKPLQVLPKYAQRSKNRSSSSTVSSSSSHTGSSTSSTRSESDASIPSETTTSNMPIIYTPTRMQMAFLESRKAEIAEKRAEFIEGCQAYQRNPTPPSQPAACSHYSECYPGKSLRSAVEAALKHCKKEVPVYCGRATGTYQKFCLQELEAACQQ